MNLFKTLILAAGTACFLNCSTSQNSIDEVGKQLFTSNWKIKPSSSTKLTGEKLSLGEKDDSASWIDAPVPGTIMNALVQNSTYKNLYERDNMQKVPSEQFKHSWFYTRDFSLSTIDKNSHYQLNFEGINYKANIWLNGKKLADTTTIVGAFNRFTLLIDSAVLEGINHLAIELFPPSIGAYTIGFVDWAPTPPDNRGPLPRGGRRPGPDCRVGARAPAAGRGLSHARAGNAGAGRGRKGLAVPPARRL